MGDVLNLDFGVAVSTFALLFLAEMGDKSQLVAMTLAHGYRTLPVVIGTFAAFTLLNLLAILVGEALGRYVPRELVLIAAGILFLAFAWRSWFTEDEDASLAETAGRGALLTSFTVIFLAELGDKTQLAMIALAAESGAIWSVFVGGTAALWAVSLLGIVVGRTLLRRVPTIWVHRAAAILFGVFGVLALSQVLVGWGR